MWGLKPRLAQFTSLIHSLVRSGGLYAPIRCLHGITKAHPMNYPPSAFRRQLHVVFGKTNCWGYLHLRGIHGRKLDAEYYPSLPIKGSMYCSEARTLSTLKPHLKGYAKPYSTGVPNRDLSRAIIHPSLHLMS